jgi:hypothetical protein
MLFRTLVMATLLPCAALADTADIQNHEVQVMFLTSPCKTTVATIDQAAPTPKGMGKMTMAFGFLMGFEAAHPGIRGTHETILKRLREDCANDPSTTAMDLLNGYVLP